MRTDTRENLNSCLSVLNKVDSMATFEYCAFLDELEGGLRADSCRQVQTLLGNLKPFKEHLEAAQKTMEVECPLFTAFKADLLKSARRTLISMLQNCLQAAEAASSHSLKSLLSGKEADVRSLVPSRMLARELGVSDQTLRREIYLARQKAAMPKHFDEERREGQSSDESDRSFVESLTTTCASPVRMDDDSQEEDEWLDVEAWLNAEIFA